MMYRPLVIIFLVLALAGCATMDDHYEMVEDPDPAVRRFVSYYQLHKGLTRKEVMVVLGDQVIIGYEMPDTRKELYKPVVIKNPHRTENYQKGRHVYVIDYYFSGINAADDKISDDELTPLVFKEDVLVGWGRDYLRRIKNDTLKGTSG